MTVVCSRRLDGRQRVPVLLTQLDGATSYLLIRTREDAVVLGYVCLSSGSYSGRVGG